MLSLGSRAGVATCAGLDSIIQSLLLWKLNFQSALVESFIQRLNQAKFLHQRPAVPMSQIPSAPYFFFLLTHNAGSYQQAKEKAVLVAQECSKNLHSQCYLISKETTRRLSVKNKSFKLWNVLLSEFIEKLQNVVIIISTLQYGLTDKVNMDVVLNHLCLHAGNW